MTSRICWLSLPGSLDGLGVSGYFCVQLRRADEDQHAFDGGQRLGELWSHQDRVPSRLRVGTQDDDVRLGGRRDYGLAGPRRLVDDQGWRRLGGGEGAG